jgi:hypothetical protein
MFKGIVAGMLALLSVAQEDRGAVEAKAHQELMLTESIAAEAQKAPKSRTPREWSALLFTVLENETHGSLRIHEGRCKPLECDRGRARGPFQEQKSKRNAHFWDQLVGVENTAVQVASASEALKRAYWYSRKHCPDAVWVDATLTTFAGRSCRFPWSGLKPRLASFAKFVGAREALP